MKIKNISKLLIAIFPSIIIRILCISVFLSMFNVGNLGLKNSLFISLAVIIPFMFLLQGGLCALTDTSVYISLTLSIISFLYMAIIYLDRNSIIGLIYYIAIGYSAYLIVSIIKKKDCSKYYKNIKK